MSYVLTPQPGSNTSHQIRTAEALANVPIREALELAKQKARKTFLFDPLKLGAKKIGGGVYGTAYLIKITPSVINGLQEGLAYGGGRIVTTMPRVGEQVVIKIARQSKNRDAEFYQENIRENIVHKRMSTAQCRPVPRASKPICVSKYVPPFKLSFIDGAPGRHESVTVMGLAGDMSLNKFVKGKSIPATFYVDVERAICSMWLDGYLHGDLHRENIMIDTRNNKVHIIDFGFALKMPPAFVDVLARRISNMVSRGKFQTLGDIWTEKPVDGKLRLINYSDRVMKGRGFPWYNPDYKILRSLWNQVPRNQRTQIPAARSALWGIPIIQEPVKQKTSKTIRQRSATPQRKQKSSSPVLRASAAKTYMSSQIIPRTASPVDRPFQKSKSPVVRPFQKSKSPVVRPFQKSKSPVDRPFQKSKSPVDRPFQKSKKLPSPSKQMQKPRTPYIPTPMRSLSNAERAVVYGQGIRQDKIIANIQQRKMECRRRGLEYNPITKQCTMQQQKTAQGRCRIDCAAIGKRCGPRGKCVKL
ncbi:PBCV-specific basic adaptor domain-containing protein [Paramecium bursaria Chlorella virus CVA-1]|uniref:PBCV-specific basic adaptor domain-containing protein n=1 Tax=Paramecium bursaria Chlorella virus CVA-1 TaxID=42683 RepID=M1HKF3_9PHYC|nr:PBCV-specific basic adaptor domain-containing protein [Paramecium bursaria Chlorella virus CVA-1]AGE50644.1 PBCV-specific basic adaptor domain-containing protein [Paramecium bursaria Chlorella virus CVA-1]